MLFGSNNGLCYFRPADVLKNYTCPPANITKLYVEGSGNDLDSCILLMGKKEIELNYEHNTFTVCFNVRNYALSDGVEYEYMLDGNQKKWIATNDCKITFRDLVPGDYTLNIRCRLHNKQWSSEISSVNITVNPPFWLTWWAKLIYVLLTIMIVYVSLRYYNKHLHLEYLYDSEKRRREHEQILNDERLQFYTNITHELRTPLTLIIGPLEDLINDRMIKDSVEHKVVTIYKSAKRLNDLISKLLEFRKTETDNRQLCVGRGNIVAVIKEICDRYDELNQNSKVKITFTAQQDIINVYFDKEILNMIMDNLISNAMKYTERGYINIDVRCVSEEEEELLLISVTDTGHGISQKAIPHIFERYYQEKGSYQASGTGIGLALVKNLVTLHQGTVSVDSREETGSKFTVRLKLHNTYSDAVHSKEDNVKDENIMPEEVMSADKESEESERIHPILLIVEDNKDICQYIAECFKDSFDIKMAENGKQGLKIAFDTIPDIIISDVMMPYMNGNEMCKMLKRDIRTCHIPIILLTAKDSMVAKEEGYDSGADSYITKPFVKSLIASRINNLLEQRRRMALVLNDNKDNSGVERKKEIMMLSLSEMDKKFLQRIDELIECNVSSDTMDVNFLADNLNVSYSTLYRKMKALTGLSCNEYIRKRKMIYAEKLLLEGKFTISEIGYMVGMNTTAYFRKCFKEEFGEIPSEYLKNIKEI